MNEIETGLPEKESRLYGRRLIWILIGVVFLGIASVAALDTDRLMSRACNWWARQNDPCLARAHQLLRESNTEKYWSDPSTDPENRLFEAGRKLQNEFPGRKNGYGFMIAAAEHSEWKKHLDHARMLANELMNSSAPEEYKLWAKGLIDRLDLQSNQVVIKFMAVDGREVDLEKMRGKVVLVDFWATDCRPCVEALPRIKTALGQYRQRGLEVIGISCDTDKTRLDRFLRSREIGWPQYFDGKQQPNNKLMQSFGIVGIPHMFLLDRKGCLRFDNVWAAGSKTNFEDKIESLLAEQ